MTARLKTIIYPVTDISKAKTLYGQLLGVAVDGRALLRQLRG